MNHTTLRLLIVAAAAAAGMAACDDIGTPDTPLAPTNAPSLAVAGVSDIDGNYLVLFKGNSVPSGFESRVAALGGSVMFAHAGAGVGAVRGLTPQAAAQLGASSGVAAVELDDMTVLSPMMGEVEEAGVGVESPSAPATAFFYPRQWHLRAIQADVAWAAGRRGSPAIKVAIIDTGLGYTHPDLAGHVDLANSKSFVPSDDALLASLPGAPFVGAHPVADLHYHGTHVGATVSSNAVAAAGVTSRVTLVGVKVCTVNGSCPTSGVLAGVLYAADLGVHVANLSLGGRFLRRDASAEGGNGPSFLAIINNTFNYAHRKGTTVVVSAGNDGIDMDHDGNGYKAYCSAATVICVSATGPTSSGGVNGPFFNVDALAGYSNYGSSAVSVAAPGGNQRSVWAACSTFSLQIPVCRTGTFVVGLNGTSMATPHATGVAALIAEDVGRSPAQIRARLQQTADDLGPEGTDPAYGKGRINAARAAGVI
ncbi:MAG TPA: S8 family serine peptidase [Longimicrobium sp.]|nr:S8 family serine peptidase [Longimicrobium sp.]